ncbi:MAG: 50S ribosome-binding GTPase [Candidatus Pacearchaeota archaeon]|nr:50S ribosome-binding GTPase [Candidatus Pacearchaeota archaeon]
MKTGQKFSKGKKHDTSRISRKGYSDRARKLENIKKQRGKYPILAYDIVHMSDIILEVLDARFITETRNYEIEEQIKKEKKEIIYVINKTDLIDRKKIKEEDILSLSPRAFVSCPIRRGIKELRNKIKFISTKITNPVDNVLNKITVGVVGYPNTGKSSIINSLIGKKTAGTGADAGFTKGIQKVKLTSEIMLLDSPGIIPNREYSGVDSRMLSQHTKLGARSSTQVKNPGEVVNDLMKEFPLVFDNYYGVDSGRDSEILIEKVGRKKGMLKKGNVVDEDRTARLIIRDWQQGKIRR